MSEARLEHDDEKKAFLSTLARDYNRAEEYFAKELEAIEIQYQKDLVMAKRAERILKQKRAASQKAASEPGTNGQVPPGSEPTVESEKPKKGKSRNGRGSGPKEGDRGN